MKTWIACALSAACLSALATEPSIKKPERTEFERSFIEKKFYRSARSLNGCEYYGGMIPFDDLESLRITHFVCDGRLLALLNRPEKHEWQRNPEWFVVLDALLLPPMKEISYDLKLIGDCEDKRKPAHKNPDNFFFVVAPLPKHKTSVNWKTGVKAAWTINRQSLKFEEYPIRHIVCYEQTDP